MFDGSLPHHIMETDRYFIHRLPVEMLADEISCYSGGKRRDAGDDVTIAATPGTGDAVEHGANYSEA